MQIPPFASLSVLTGARSSDSTSYASGDHLRVHIWLCAVDITDVFKVSRAGLAVDLKCSVTTSDSRFCNRSPWIVVTEDTCIFFISRWVGGNFSQIQIILGISRLQDHDTVFGIQTLFNRIQSFFRLAVIYTDISKYTESLWFDVNLAFFVFFGSDFFAKCIVGTEIKALYEITPLMGIKTLLGGNAEVTFVQGYKRDEKKEESEANWQETSLEDGGGSRKEEQSVDVKVKEERALLRKEAAELAAQYDEVILVGGLNHEHDSEGIDRADMKLPYEQDELIREVLKANPNTVIVMMAGSPVEMGSWIKDAKAVVWNWYSGMEGGNALAEVLFGRVSPSGKLPETFYKKHTDCSAHAVGEFPGDEKVRYKESVFVGYRYNDTFGIEPEFCFGHGLSYTTFAYSGAEIKRNGAKLQVSCDVTNTGDRAGKESDVVEVRIGSSSRNIRIARVL